MSAGPFSFPGGDEIELTLGLIFSQAGSYAALGRSALSGALRAIEAVNRSGRLRVRAEIRDPAGDAGAYERHTADLLDGGVRHILGAITSWSRKDMIPALERGGGLLWYPCPYEGFECNDHVVYLGAAPNHHILPLAEWIAAEGMRTAFLVGSNYVWGWETSRLARDCLTARGVEVIGERYVPLGSTDHGHVVDEVVAARPDVVVNSLIGPSNVAFVRDLGRRAPDRVGRTGHMVSCNQTEVDLADLGSAAEGLLAAGAFFEADAPEGLSRAVAAADPGTPISSFLATSYAAVELLAGAVLRAGTDDPRAVFRAVSGSPTATVLGQVAVDPVMRHAALAPRLAVVRDGRFDVIRRAAMAVPADPYLSQAAPAARRPGPPHLRVVQ